ncbi:MAG: hypothetical protein ACI86C_001077 [Candidatus Latescibacterota bacterium]|jgi:hypothetical protein
MSEILVQSPLLKTSFRVHADAIIHTTHPISLEVLVFLSS